VNSMKVLIFDLVGTLAHFRRVNTTTSSLTYAFPPRTTIAGIVAGVLGLEKDSYYESFLPKRCSIGIQVVTPIRKIVQTINYLDTDQLSQKRLRGKTARVQIPTEFVIADGKGLPFSALRYRILFHHNDRLLMRKLATDLKYNRTAFPQSLGSANCLAVIEKFDIVDATLKLSSQAAELSTVIPKSRVDEILPKAGTKLFVEEIVPFSIDSRRENTLTEDYLYYPGGTIWAKLHGDILTLSLEGKPFNGVFL